MRKAAKRGLTRRETTQDGHEVEDVLDKALPLSRVPLREMSALRKDLSTDDRSGSDMPGEKSNKPTKAVEATEQFQMWDPDDDDEEALIAAAMEEEARIEKERRQERARKDDELSGGVAAALAKLREKG